MRLPLLKTFHLPCTALAATIHQIASLHLHFMLFSISGSLQNFDKNVTGKAGALQFCGAESFLCARKQFYHLLMCKVCFLGSPSQVSQS